jgi:hypothetical protein
MICCNIVDDYDSMLKTTVQRIQRLLDDNVRTLLLRHEGISWMSRTVDLLLLKSIK